MSSTNHHGRFTFDPASFQYNYSRDHGMTGTEAAANTLTGGLFVNSFTGAVNAREQKKQYEAEQQRIAAQQAQREHNIAQLRAVYGVGDDPTAHANAATLSDFLGRYYRDLLSTNLREADQQYATTSRQSRQNLARVGQLGSGLDAASTAGTLSDYLRARQQAVVDAASRRDQLQASLTGQRLNFENQIANGGLANPDFGSIAAQRDAQLQQAQGQIAPAALGNLFNVAGQTYQQGRIQDAYGNQGMRAFGFGGGSGGSGGGGGGRIS